MKKRGQKGFTLMEMLIVVAIIAILVVIAIPIFNSSLDNARKQTDAANERAAKACGAVEYLEGATPTANVTKKFDPVSGKLVDSTTSVTGYGQSTANSGKWINVTIGTDGTVTIAWTKS